MPQYSDLPKGAVPYSDLPSGAVPIDGTQPQASIPTQGTLSAGAAPSWGTELEQDLREGGSRTAIGRFLGRMQGRGDQGYSGLESGVSPATAQYVGSPELGAAKMIQGAQQVPQHPLQGALRMGAGALQAGTLPSMFLGGPAADAAIQAMPSRAAAGRMFNSVMADAENVPVSLTRSMAPLERTQQLASSGASPVRVADQLYQRANTVNPIPYREARDFASNISSLSPNEVASMNGPMGSAVNNLRGAFHQDIADAAGTVGRGQDYLNAVREYARASQMSDTAKTIAKYLAGAAGAGAAYKLFGDFTGSGSGH